MIGSLENILLNGAGGRGGSYAYRKAEGTNKKGETKWSDPVYGGVAGSSWGLSKGYEVNDREFLGVRPPKLSKKQEEEGEMWVQTDNVQTQSRTHNGGSARSSAPVWQRISRPTSAASAAPAPANTASNTPASGGTQTPFRPSPELSRAVERVNAYNPVSSGSSNCSSSDHARALNAGTPGNLYGSIHCSGEELTKRVRDVDVPWFRSRAVASAFEMGETAQNNLNNWNPMARSGGQPGPGIPDVIDPYTTPLYVRGENGEVSATTAFNLNKKTINATTKANKNA